MSATFTTMSTSLATKVVTRLEPLVENHYQLNDKLVKALEEVPLYRTRGSRDITPDLPLIGHSPRVLFSHIETKDPLVSSDPQNSSHESQTREISLSL